MCPRHSSFVTSREVLSSWETEISRLNPPACQGTVHSIFYVSILSIRYWHLR